MTFQKSMPQNWPDGRHHSLTHRFPIPDEHGLPYMVGVIAVDITARHQAEMEVKRQAAIMAGMNSILRQALVCNTEVELGRTCLALTPARRLLTKRCLAAKKNIGYLLAPLT